MVKEQGRWVARMEEVGLLRRSARVTLVIMFGLVEELDLLFCGVLQILQIAANLPHNP